MNFKIGQVVTIPSGEKIQIKEIRYHWVHMYGAKQQNRIKSVCDLTLDRGFGNTLTIRDYQCEYFSDMPECAG